MATTYLITAEGLNLHHLIEFFERQKLEVFSLNRLDSTHLSFQITKNSYKKLKKSPLYNLYKFSIDEVQGGEKIAKTLVKRCGLFIGIIAVILITMNLTNRILKVELIEENHHCKNQSECIFEEKNKEKLYNLLAEHGIKTGAFKSSIENNREIEKVLMKNFPQIAAANIKVDGVVVKIDILEATLPASYLSDDLVSSVSGIVVSTDVSSGELLVKNGDIVLEGQTLVKAISDTPVTATIVVRTFFHDLTIYNENQVSYRRTGRKQTDNVLSFFSLTGKEKGTDFTLYESTTKTSYAFYNYFLPIKNKVTTYYELEKVEAFVPFEEAEEKVKAELEDKVRDKLPLWAEEKATTFATYREGTRVRVDCYIETYLTIKK